MYLKQLLASAGMAVLLGTMLSLNAIAYNITDWGMETGAANAILAEGLPGNFTTSTPTTGAGIRSILSTPIPFSTVGDVAVFRGTVSFENGPVTNQQFRLGLFNTNGHAAGTLSDGVWSGGDPSGWLGYLFSLGGGGASGQDTVRGRSGEGTATWRENANSAVVGSTSTGINAPAGTNYDFSYVLTRTGDESVQVDYSFVGGTLNRSNSFTDTTTGSRTMGSFNAIGFNINGNTGALTATNLRIVEAPIVTADDLGDVSGFVMTTLPHSDPLDEIWNWSLQSFDGPGGPVLNASVDSASGEFSWNSAGQPGGVYTAMIQAEDAYSRSSTAALTFTLIPGDLPGDFNGDTIVDAADYVYWRKTNSGDPIAYQTWVTNFGTGAAGSGSGGAASAPEPSIFGLIAIAGMVVVWLRKRDA